jgi:hypothetical protein
MSFKKRSAGFLKEARKFRVAPEVTSAVIKDYLAALDCPRSLAVWLMYSNNEHAQLADFGIDPLHYRNVMEFRDAYSATKFLSKFPGLTLGYDLDQVALENFEKFEQLCKWTNKRFRDLSADPLFVGPVVWLHNEVIRKIDRILGAFDVDDMFLMANWGPGASTDISRRDASAANKFQLETGITRDLYAFLPDGVLAGFYPMWHSHLTEIGFPNFQVGNKVVTVPKDATANRVIAIEPGFNTWFQSAIGKMMRKRLLGVGIDLRFQSQNQLLAYLGSKTLDLATVDMSSASDSISKGVVEALIPPRWLTFLDATRSRYGQLGGSVIEWEKFSSMGNGFTFPLQTIIFYAAAKAVVEYLHESPLSARENIVSAYGDDIIVPVRCLELFSTMCEFYGFKLNMKKTHYSSTFRESCGSHYMMGSDVKPIYLKDSLTDVLSVYRLANAIRRLAHSRAGKLACDGRLRRTFDHLVKLVPKALRLMIPDGLGDGGFICNFDETVPDRAKHCIEGYFAVHATAMAKTHEFERIGLLFARLWRMSEQGSRYNAPFRGRAKLRDLAKAFRLGEPQSVAGLNQVSSSGRTSLRLSRGLVQQWYDLGPWV